MSRRGAEFQHRTSVFEGAYRAWSHLGGIDPLELETKSATELDPITNPIEDDYRLSSKGSKEGFELEYPYEPLPRNGLGHPFVKAVLVPWLGPDVDEEGVKLGLDTLRTWWQHRRKGQNASAVKALNSEKMRKSVDEYTRHFFRLVHCLIVSDKEQPPKGLQVRLKMVGKLSSTGVLCSGNEDTDHSDWKFMNLKDTQSTIDSSESLSMRGKCIPGHLDLPELVKGVNHKALQMAHRGKGSLSDDPLLPTSGSVSNTYGDSKTFPVVYYSGNGDCQIALTVNGIICAHCVKIVETVLKGCSGPKSPIDGLIDAIADQELNGLVIKIDKAINAKRIAYECARNLALVGYKAVAIDMPVLGPSTKQNVTSEDLSFLIKLFEKFKAPNFPTIFNWAIACTCPDGGVYKSNCSRHVQIHGGLLEHFLFRRQQILDCLGSLEKTVPISALSASGRTISQQYEHNTPKQVEAEEEEPIVIEQEMKLTALEPIAFENYAISNAQTMDIPTIYQDTCFLPPNLNEASSDTFWMGHDQQRSYGTTLMQPTILNRGRSNGIFAQQHMSALASEFGLPSDFDWDQMDAVLNSSM